MGLALALRSAVVAAAAMVVNVAASFLWVFIYSMLIVTGHNEAFHDAYAARAAPWCSVVAGVPILVGAGWLLTRWHGGGWRTGIWVGIAYAFLDTLILAAAGMIVALLPIVALSHVTKITAAALGGRAASRRLAKA